MHKIFTCSDKLMLKSTTSKKRCPICGHFSAGFTPDTYAHVTTSAQKEAAQAMGNVPSM